METISFEEFKTVMDKYCWECGSEGIHPIDSHWECSRPYKIFMCPRCKHMFFKYEDEMEDD